MPNGESLISRRVFLLAIGAGGVEENSLIIYDLLPIAQTFRMNNKSIFPPFKLKPHLTSQ